MHRITFIILLFSATAADAAWYQKTDGTIVDPIQSVFGGDHAWSYDNLQSGAYLSYADLSGAYLNEADLRNANLYAADLTGADLTDVDMENVDLRDAILVNADLTNAILSGTDLSGTDLSGSDFSSVRYWWNDPTATWTDAFYYTDNEPTWRADMDVAWRTSEGILALPPTNAVPEPSTLLLALLGLALLPRRRRR